MEEAGQLNMFDQLHSQGKVVSSFGDAFQKALHLDETGSSDAIKVYRQAIDQGIRPSDALCNIATIEAANGDIKSAISTLSEALVLDPRHALSHYNLGNVYLEAGNLELAELHYEQAIGIDPSLIEVYYNLALVLLINDNRTRATKLLEQYQDMTSESLDIARLIDRLLV